MANRYYTRRFLNKRGHHAGAYVLAAVEDTSNRKDDCRWVDVEFTIADCNRQISLDFGVDPGEIANSLHKVDILLDSLAKFRVALVAESHLAAERERSAPRNAS